jgi:hypothetical protein
MDCRIKSGNDDKLLWQAGKPVAPWPRGNIPNRPRLRLPSSDNQPKFSLK